MTGFKLTGGQIDEIYEKWYTQQCEGSNDVCCEVTAKAQRKAIAEWLDGACEEHHQFRIQHLSWVKRWDCPSCRQQLREEVK